MRWEWQDKRERKEMTELDIEENRVGLRCQIKVLVQKGVGSNPTLNNLFFMFFFFC